MALAFQTDSTRIITFALDSDPGPIDGSGVRENHHNVSHHGGVPETLDKVTKIDRWHVAQLAYFLDKLRATPDVGGTTLLDNSIILHGSGMGDGNVHDHELRAHREHGRQRHGGEESEPGCVHLGDERAAHGDRGVRLVVHQLER